MTLDLGPCDLRAVLLACFLLATAATLRAQPSPRSIDLAIDDGLHAWALARLDDLPEPGGGDAVLLRAKGLIAAGEPAEALRVLDEADPGPAGVPFWRALALFRADRPREALAALDKLAVDPAAPWMSSLALPAARLRLRCHLALDELDLAQRVMDSAHAETGLADKLAAGFLDDAAVAWRRDDTNRLARALGMLETLPVTRPESVTARQWEAEFALRRGERDLAAAKLRSVVDQKDLPTALRRGALVRMAQVLTNPGEAAALLAEAEALEPSASERAALTVRRGQRLLLGGDRGGLETMRGAIPLLTDPALGSSAQLFLADWLFATNEFTEAEAAYDAHLLAFTNQADRVRALSGKAWSVWQQERYTEAASLFQRLYQDADPGDRDTKKTALLKSADAQFEAEQYEDAIQSYQRFSRLFFGDELQPQAILQAALCKRRLGQPEEAERELRTLSTVYTGTPHAEKALLEIAAIHQDSGRLEPASALYEDYLSRFTGGVHRAEAILNQAICHYRLDDFGRAQEGFERLLREHPGHPLAERAAYMQGWTLFLQGDIEAARRHFEQFLERFPNSAWQEDILFWLAERHYNYRRLPEAEQGFSHLASRFPDGRLVGQALYWAGRAAAEQKKYTVAVEHFAALVKDHPDHPRRPDALYAQADALAILGKCPAAIDLCRQLIQNHPESYLVPNAWNRIGDCQYANATEGPDQYLDALASFQSALGAKGISFGLRLQAMYRVATIHRNRGENEQAIEQYTAVVYAYLEHRDRLDREAVGWFHQSAYEAARLLEAARRPREAIGLYRRIVAVGGPEAKEAEKRIQSLRLERFSPFSP